MLTEREQEIDGLRASRTLEDQIRLVADSLPVLISYVDSELCYRYNNKGYETWFGGKRRQVYGRHLREVLGQATFDAIRPYAETALAGERVSADLRLPYRGAGERFVHIEYVPDRRADGTVAGFFALVQDISESKKVEQALRESEARFRDTADSAPLPVWVTGRNGVEFVNHAFAEFAGLPAERLLGDEWSNLVHPEDLPEMRARREAAWAGEDVFSFEARFRRHDGAWRWLHATLKPRLDDAGRRIGFVGMATDVTDARRAEAELRESEARFRAIADCAAAPVWVTSEKGIEFVNRAFVEVAGGPAEGLTGERWMEIIHPDDLPPVLERRARAWQTGEGYGYDARFRAVDGDLRWMRVSCRPRFDVAGRLIGYVGMAVDFTEQKRAEDELRESEARFRDMADSAPAPVWVTNEAGIEFANRGLAEFTGLTVEQLRGDAWIGLCHPDDVGAVMEERTRAWEARAPYGFEARFRRSDGAWRWLRATCKPRESDGTFKGYVGLAMDITEARQAEEELRASEDRLRLATDAAAIGTWDFDPVTGELRWDTRCKALFGLPADAEVDYARFLAGLHPEDRERADRAVQQALDPAGPGDFNIEYRTVAPEDGPERWIAARGRAVFEDGQAVRFIGTVIDISERKRAEAVLAQKEAALLQETRLLETVNRVGASLAGELDLERVVQMVTDAGVEVTGAQFGALFYNVLDAGGESYMLYTISGVDRGAFEKFPMPRNTAVFAPTFNGEGIVRSDDITKDPRYGRNAPHRGMPAGHLPVASYLAAPVVARSGEVIGGLFFGHAEPGRFTERHERLIEGIAGQAAVAVDNARLFEAAQREIVERARAQDALRDLNHSLEARIDAAIAEREQVEEALRQAQKMEAVGQLTGGIAHDFNNLLTVIAGNLDLAARRLGTGLDPAVQRALGSAMTGAERAATLTQRLLAFSRRQPLAPKPTDANALLAGMSDLLHRTLGETIQVETRLAAGLPRIEVDPHQLESAILNLAVNARDAMPGGGRLVIETAAARLEEERTVDGEQVAAGHYVEIKVADTGTGMSPDTLRRALEPFFTTKEVGKGTGLGLSMVYGFVRQSGGQLRIESEAGQGTSVRIYLPRLAAESVEEEQAEAAAAPRGGGDEIILVCEDDEDVRAYTVELLAELGYQVLEAGDAAATLKLLEDPERRIDMLFTDVVLPGGISGADLAAQARLLRPGLRILYTTGYARDAIVHEGRLDPGVELIAKPFGFAELATRVRDMLDRN